MSTEYSGWRREKTGVIGDVSGAELMVVMAGLLPLWGALVNAAWAALLPAVAIAVIVTGAVIGRVQHRPLYRWGVDALAYRVARVAGWSRFSAQASTGRVPAGDLERLDLPGPLAGLRVHDGPPWAGAGMARVCLVQDPKRWWTVVASMTHPGLTLAGAGYRDQWASELGRLMESLAQAIPSSGPRRFSITVRSVPDDGTARALWHRQHLSEKTPQEMRAALDALEAMTTAAGVRHEIFIAVRFDEGILGKQARHAGGGVDGRAKVIYRLLPDIQARLQAAGAESVRWLTTGQLAAAVRAGYNLGDQVGISLAGVDAIPAGMAGPSHAPSPAPRSYLHDAYRSASYALILPSERTHIGSLGPLLTPAIPGERRCLALHYEVFGTEEAERKASRNLDALEVKESVAAQKGFRRSPKTKRQAARARQQEERLVDGHALVRMAGAVSVTAPAAAEIEAHAALLESAALRGGFHLMRLDLAQDSGFVAAVLPLGIGLPPRRKRIFGSSS